MLRVLSLTVMIALVACDAPDEATPPLGPIGTLRGQGSLGAHYGLGTYSGGTVTLGTPVIDGALAADALQSVFAERGGELEFCYAHRLESVGEEAQQGIDGHLLVAFDVWPSGEVHPPVTFAEDTVSDAVLADCIAQTVGGWTFTPHTGIAHVRYPLELSYEPPPPG